MVSLVMCHSTPKALGNPSRTVTPTPSLEQVACLLYQASPSEVTEKKSFAGVERWPPKPLLAGHFHADLCISRSTSDPGARQKGKQTELASLSQPGQGQLTLWNWRQGEGREGTVPKFSTKP